MGQCDDEPAVGADQVELVVLLDDARLDVIEATRLYVRIPNRSTSIDCVASDELEKRALVVSAAKEHAQRVVRLVVVLLEFLARVPREKSIQTGAEAIYQTVLTYQEWIIIDGMRTRVFRGSRESPKPTIPPGPPPSTPTPPGQDGIDRQPVARPTAGPQTQI